MTAHSLTDGFHSVPIVDLGRQLQNLGLTVVEHPEFGGVTPVHSDNSFHKYGEAIDIQDWRDDVIDGVGWQQRTSNLRDLLRGSGAEVIGPGDMSGHDTHLHLSARDGIFKLNPTQYNAIFSGTNTSTFDPASFAAATDDNVAAPATTSPKEKAQDLLESYKDMSKAKLNQEYDKLRSTDPAKARTEGMKMHKAFFNK